MKAIISIFTSIFSTIEMFVTNFINGIKMFIKFLEYLSTITDMLKDFTGTMPVWFGAFFSMSIGVIVLYLLIGRSPGR